MPWEEEWISVTPFNYPVIRLVDLPINVEVKVGKTPNGVSIVVLRKLACTKRFQAVESAMEAFNLRMLRFSIGTSRSEALVSRLTSCTA